MIKEFRYSGIKRDTNSVVRGSIYTHSLTKAKAEIADISKQHNFATRLIEEKKTYIYRAVNRLGKRVKGEQEAFNKDELLKALQSLGYTNIKIEPMLFNIIMKPPLDDIVMFISLSSDMLKENMKYEEILKILSSDIQNKTLRNTIKNISRDLRQGQDGQSVFNKYTDIFGKFTAYMLGLASKSGNMAEIYDSTAKYMNRQAEFKKNLKQALVMPGVTLLIITLCVAYYIMDLFPSITEMFVKYGIPLPPMTAATLKLSNYMQDNWIMLFIIFVSPFAAVGYWFTTEKGSLFKDRYILKLPFIGSLIHKMTIEIFFRVFSIIYSGSGNNIEVLQVSAEACGNKHMEKRIKEITIPRMLKQGAGLIEALEEADVFTDTVISRLNAGAATGSIKKAAQQISMYYEKETGYKFKSILSTVDVLTALVIMGVMTLLIIVSSESAFMKPKLPGVQ